MVRDRIKGLRRVKAKDLAPNPRNWRRHPEEQIQAMRSALDRIGYTGALLARETDDGLVLVDGHLRADIDPEQKVPVLVLDIDEDEADEVLLTFDPIGGMAGIDVARLTELAGAVRLDDLGLVAMIDEVMAVGQRALDAAADDGEPAAEAPALPDKPITRPGDLWLLGDHRLLCGDAGSTKDVDRLLAGEKIHLVNTDPPYNVKVEPRSNNAIAAGVSSFSRRADLQCQRSTTKRGAQDRQRLKKKRTHHQSFDVARQGEKKATTKKMRPKDRPLVNDFVSDKEFAVLLRAWFGQMARVLKPGRGFYIWGGYANIANYPSALVECKLYFSQTIIWVKEHPVLTRKDFMGNHEWCFYGWREGAAHHFLGPPNVPDVWAIKKVNPASMIHLTEKPVALATKAINCSSRPGENILDLFGGSGSTLMSCIETSRRGYTMELDPAYCDVIVGRFEKQTGTKAKRSKQ